MQALQLCQKAGLVKLGHVAIDGTKMQANASKHKAMSYGRMGEAEQKLQAEVEALLRHAEEVDEAEDRQYGKGQRGDELPPELARRESRLKKIREAKEALEAEAQQKAQEQKAEAEAKIAAGRSKRNRPDKNRVGGLLRFTTRKRPNQNLRHSGISPIQKVALCPMERTREVSCRPTMLRRRWIARHKSLSQQRSRNKATTNSSWCRCCNR